MGLRDPIVSRRRLLKLGGVGLIGTATAFALPGVAAGRQPPGQLKKQLRLATPTPAPTATPTGTQPTQPTASPTPQPALTATPATSTPYRALDTDFGQRGVQPQAWFDAARAAGYEGFITTLHTYWGGQPHQWLPSHDALSRALSAGMWIAAYGRPVSYWHSALVHLPPELRSQLRFFALDVEPEPSGSIPLSREHVDGVRSMGVRPVIYSGWGMWGDVMGNDSSFADIPLWDFAGDRFDWPSDLTEQPVRAYAGWNVAGNYRVGWQVQMQTPAMFNDVYVDRDLFNREFVDGV